MNPIIRENYNSNVIKILKLYRLNFQFPFAFHNTLQEQAPKGFGRFLTSSSNDVIFKLYLPTNKNEKSEDYSKADLKQRNVYCFCEKQTYFQSSLLSCDNRKYVCCPQASTFPERMRKSGGWDVPCGSQAVTMISRDFLNSARSFNYLFLAGSGQQTGRGRRDKIHY